MIPFEWVVVLLQNKEVSLKKITQKKIYFDLGSEVSLKEAELIYQISKIKDVVVFAPDYPHNDKYLHLLKPYEYLIAQLPKKVDSEISSVQKSLNIELRQFSNTVAECRDVVGQIKEWNELGISYDQMQVLAPDIEAVWPVLEPLFKLEKIPVQKNQISKITTSANIQRVLAKINFYQGKASANDLEKILFLNRTYSDVNYQNIRYLFSSPFYTFEELKSKIYNFIPELMEDELPGLHSLLSSNNEISRNEFLKILSPILESEFELNQFESILPDLLKGSSSTLKFKLFDWLEWLKISLARIEIKIERHQEGIHVDSLMSSQSFNSEFTYMMAADDRYFSQNHDYEIDPEDVLSLANDMGYHLDHPDYNFRSYELETIVNKTNKQLVLSYAKSDLMGEASNPCFLWQQLAFEKKIVDKVPDEPRAIHWNYILNQKADITMSKIHEHYDFRNYQKDYDLSVYESFSSKLNNVKLEQKVSPSSLKNYLDCSFKFYMERELALSRTDIEELDLSPKEKGSWYHKVFQKIIENSDLFDRLKVLEFDLRIIEIAKEFKDLTPEGISADFWAKINYKYFVTISKFIDHELFLIEEIPGLKTISCETKWSIYFDLDKKQWVKEKPDKGFLLRGTIDRIIYDSNTHKVWVIDYKLGSGQALPYPQWIKEDHWQLLFYTMAIENDWLEIKEDILKQSVQVELAQFWVINKWDYKKGFSLDHLNQDFLVKSKKNLINLSEKEDLLKQFTQRVFGTLIELSEKKYHPSPKKEEVCKRCDWSLVCRAPHLN
ncbi:MAG: PD-(D/E)XK nuclease family protein [Bdellovibrionales bacterium]|nr:PD-(D/E)XK nuclease family protein [Bdellovibrionales bacterium]